MASVEAAYVPAGSRRHSPVAGKVIRIGLSHESEKRMLLRSIWLTVEEAESIQRELAAAILRAKGAAGGVHPPALAGPEGS